MFPSTVIEIDFHALPPFPVDEEVSKVRLSQALIIVGAVIITFGIGGFDGS